MDFTLDEKKYIIHAINELTKQEGIQNAGIGLNIIRKLQAPAEQPVNGVDKGEIEDDVTQTKPGV